MSSNIGTPEELLMSPDTSQELLPDQKEKLEKALTEIFNSQEKYFCRAPNNLGGLRYFQTPDKVVDGVITHPGVAAMFFIEEPDNKDQQIIQIWTPIDKINAEVNKPLLKPVFEARRNKADNTLDFSFSDVSIPKRELYNILRDVYPQAFNENASPNRKYKLHPDFVVIHSPKYYEDMITLSTKDASKIADIKDRINEKLSFDDIALLVRVNADATSYTEKFIDMNEDEPSPIGTMPNPSPIEVTTASGKTLDLHLMASFDSQTYLDLAQLNSDQLTEILDILKLYVDSGGIYPSTAARFLSKLEGALEKKFDIPKEDLDEIALIFGTDFALNSAKQSLAKIKGKSGEQIIKDIAESTTVDFSNLNSTKPQPSRS